MEDELLDDVGAHVEQDVQPELEVVVEVVLAARTDDGLIARMDPHLVLVFVEGAVGAAELGEHILRGRLEVEAAAAPHELDAVRRVHAQLLKVVLLEVERRNCGVALLAVVDHHARRRRRGAIGELDRQLSFVKVLPLVGNRECERHAGVVEAVGLAVAVVLAGEGGSEAAVDEHEGGEGVGAAEGHAAVAQHHAGEVVHLDRVQPLRARLEPQQQALFVQIDQQVRIQQVLFAVLELDSRNGLVVLLDVGDGRGDGHTDFEFAHRFARDYFHIQHCLRSLG